jgi:cobalt-precorrin-5B (C1)-methyltransferase
MARKLKTGFTTGTAAAAATKGALGLLLDNRMHSKVQVELLNGDHIFIPLYACILETPETARCIVIKDAGDDPDITHKAKIGAKVTLVNNKNPENLIITGGPGVGKVTKPGLEIPPGEPAINPGPRKMIQQAVADVLNRFDKKVQARVEIFVPDGETLAQKTLNPRLGILGGISILGTTGIVKPMSHEAYIATIKSSLSVAYASGIDIAVMTTGRRSEKFAQVRLKMLPEEAFVQIGDFFKLSLEAAVASRFKRIILAVFFGKALKMAQGVPHTHAAKSKLTMAKLAAWSRVTTQNKVLTKKILSANTARHALDFIRDKSPELITLVGKRMVQSAIAFTGDGVEIQGIIFDYSGRVIFDSGLISGS